MIPKPEGQTSDVARPPEMPKERVLVVDDERVIASTLALVLKSCGYEARHAFSGPEAVALAREFQPEILLTDFEMPEMNGLEVIRQVRKLLPGCRAMVITGRAGSVEKAGRFADVRVLQKPVPIPDLVKALRPGTVDTTGAGRPLRVLVVEDQEIKRYSVTRWLLRNGFEVEGVGTAAELEQHDAQSYDCVLLDIKLPDGNGFDMAQRLRAHSVSTPIIHFSASLEGDEAEARSSASGADAFVPSSIDPDSLVFTIREKVQIHLLKNP